MSAVRALALALAFFSSVSGAVSAQEGTSLARALEAYGAGRLDAALLAFETALVEGGRTPAELAQIHTHLGVLRGSLGDADAARRDFEIALALEPDAPAPAELNPTLRAVFEAVRAERGGTAIVVELDVDGAPARETPLSGRVRLTGAPGGAVASIVVTARIEGASEPRWSEPFDATDAEVPFQVPPSAWSGASEVVLLARALDVHGNALTSAERPIAVPPAPVALTDDAVSPAEEEAEDEGGFFSTAWPWVILGVLVAGAAATIAILFATASEQPIVGAPVVR